MNKKTLYIFSAILTILSLIGFAISAVLIEYNMKYWWTILISALLFIVLFIFTCVAYFPNAEFICKKCNKQFKPSINASLWSIHTITRRYLKRPHCNEKSWSKETWDIKK